MKRYIMQRKKDGKFFVKLRPNSGFGDLMTTVPSKAQIYSHPNPGGFSVDRNLWKPVEVKVTVEIIEFT